MKNTKYIWIIGSPRSGTTMLTDFLGNFTSIKYNEPWDSYPPNEYKKWQFPDVSSIVFKYCRNWEIVDFLVDKFPNSKFIHIIRNPYDVVYSMMFPKSNSYPVRNFEEFGQLDTLNRFTQVVNRWCDFIQGCLKIKDKYPEMYKEVLYENIDVEGLSGFLNIKLDADKFLFTNKNLNKKTLSSYWNKFSEQATLRRKINKIYYNIIEKEFI